MADDKSYLPAQSEIIDTIQFTPPLKKNGAMAAAFAPGAAPPSFRILVTNILDPYEKQHSAAILAAAAIAVPAVASDNFAGHDRKVAKLSIAPGPVKTFGDLGNLLGALPTDAAMRKKKISRDPDSNRVAEEKKNVAVDVWLYASSREADNDFHLILGRDPDDDADRRYMNAEVSGLPTNDPPRTQFKGVRTSFAAIVANHLPGPTYHFYEPPIPVAVEGSLFWDASHATGSKPGPPSAKPKSIWEIHPITSIKIR